MPIDPAQTELRFDERFLEQYLGKKLISDPIVATVELVANCWDAGAQTVNITWPTESGAELRIADNGSGMTEEEFMTIWRWLGYNRLQRQSAFTLRCVHNTFAVLGSGDERGEWTTNGFYI